MASEIEAGYPRDRGVRRTAEQSGLSFSITQSWDVLFKTDSPTNPDEARRAVPAKANAVSPIYPQYFVSDVRAEQDENHRLLYRVEARYTAETTLWNPDPNRAPWDFLPEIRLGATSYQVDTDRDNEDKIITNSAGEVLTLPIQRHDPTFYIGKNVPISTNIYRAFWDFGGTVNAGPWIFANIDDGQAMMHPWDVTMVIDPVWDRYWHLDITIQINTLGWKARYADLGKMQKVDGKLVPIFHDGVPVSEPGVPLTDGKYIEGTTDITYLERDIYRKTNWPAFMSSIGV